jgi:glutaminase
MMGICIWSPPLDDQGNSFRGIEFCKRLNKEMDLHIFHNIISNKIDLSNSLIVKFLQLCCDGELEKIKEIVNKVDINGSDYDKRTGLHLAASEGHIDVVKYLLENGAEIKKDRWNNTPLDEIKSKTEDIFKEIYDLLESKEAMEQ